MKRSLLAILFLFTILFTFSSLSFAQTGSGAFISPACSTITSPVSSNSWCFDSTNLLLKVWNGSTWATITPPSYSDHIILNPVSPISPTCDTGVSRTNYFYTTATSLTVNLSNTSCSAGQDLILNYIQTGAVTITYSLTSATILWQANCDTTASCVQPLLSGNGYMDSFKFELNNVNATAQYVEQAQSFQKPLAVAVVNGGTGNGAAPSASQILVAQSATQYAPETLSGAGDLGTTTLSNAGVLNAQVTGGSHLGAKTVPASAVNCTVDGQIPIASSAGNPACATITAGSNVTVTNSNNGITIASTGGAASYTLREHFSAFECLASCGPPVAGIVVGDRGVYNQQQVSNTTTSNNITIGASTTLHPGVWTLTTGTTAGNDGIFMQGTHFTNTAAFPGVSTTIYTYQTVFQLGSVTTNGYFAVGVMDTTNSPGTSSWLGNLLAQGFWCDVTNTTSAGNWACHSQQYSGGMQKTDLVLSPVQTADTNWHTLKITAILTSGTNGTLTFYFDGTNVGTIGTNIFTGAAGPAWEAKLVSGTTAQTINVDEWDFTQ